MSHSRFLQSFWAKFSYHIEGICCRHVYVLQSIGFASKYCNVSATLEFLGHVFVDLKTRPDIAAFVSIFPSLTKEAYEANRDVRLMHNMLFMLKKTRDVGLSFPPLDVKLLQQVAITDGCFANRSDSSSQAGFLTALMDCNGL